MSAWSIARSSGAESPARRRRVEHALARAGLPARPRGLRGLATPAAETAETAAGETAAGRRLAAALGGLGPVFAGFGRYLGTRVDLLPAGHCRELAAVPDRATPLPRALVLERLEAELGRRPAEHFVQIDEAPRRSTLLFETRAARLTTGEAVLVRLVRPGIEEAIDEDLPLLELLGPAYAAAGGDPRTFAAAREGFAEHLDATLDLDAEREGLGLVAGDAEEFPFFTVPRVFAELCSARVLTVEDPGGENFEDAPQTAGDRAPGEGPPAASPARPLLTVWLHQALYGRAFPLAPGGGNALRLADGRVAFVGGVFVRPPAAAQAGFRAYAAALARRDPDEACRELLEASVRASAGASEESLRSRLRQAVPFRDGGWSARGETLAEHLFLGWRLARVNGFEPRPSTLAFLRGCAAAQALAETAGAGDGDPMLGALEDLLLAAGVHEFGEMASLDRMVDNLERYAAAFTELPQRLDAALTRAAEGGWERSPAAAGRAPRRAGSPALTAALLLALGAVVLLARQLGGIPGERAGALLVLIIGGLLLALVGRGGR